MSFPLPVPGELEQALPPGSSVLLAVSGGVDSSLALALLTHLGCEVRCVTFRNFHGDNPRSEAEAAAELAARFGVRHIVDDLEERFGECVREPFVEAYLAGRTPNPCVDCNREVRFPRLLELADRMGLERIATGHYARVGLGGSALYRGRDPEKDQSYFLHGLGPDVLARCVFPLGWSTKAEVREAARALGLPAAGRPESQEICFVPDDDRTILFTDRGGREGDIVDAAGGLLGRHRGLERYTIGQRRGLGVSAPEPLYVVELQRERNRVVLGPREALLRDRIEVEDFRDLAASSTAADASFPDGLVAQVRYRHAGAPVAALRREGPRCTVDLAEPVAGVAPGQYLVIYDPADGDRTGDRVIGGGRIVSAGRGEDG